MAEINSRGVLAGSRAASIKNETESKFTLDHKQFNLNLTQMECDTPQLQPLGRLTNSSLTFKNNMHNMTHYNNFNVKHEVSPTLSLKKERTLRQIRLDTSPGIRDDWLDRPMNA